MVYERIVWQYWENTPEYSEGIPYIDLCHQTVEKHQTSGTGYKLVRLSPDNLSNYLTDPHDAIKNFKPNQISQKADYIRAKILCKYGGIWLDSDTVVVKSLDPLFDMLEKYQFYGYKHDGVVCIWAFACHKEAEVMVKWCQNNDLILTEQDYTNFYLGELGHKSLQLFEDSSGTFFDDANNGMLFQSKISWNYYANEDALEKYLTNQCFVQIFNALTFEVWKRRSREEWLQSNCILSQLFRLALN